MNIKQEFLSKLSNNSILQDIVNYLFESINIRKIDSLKSTIYERNSNTVIEIVSQKDVSTPITIIFDNHDYLQVEIDQNAVIFEFEKINDSNIQKVKDFLTDLTQFDINVDYYFRLGKVVKIKYVTFYTDKNGSKLEYVFTVNNGVFSFINDKVKRKKFMNWKDE